MQEIKTASPSSATGPYRLRFTSANITVFCEMLSDGGWTLVMKLASNNFCYGANKCVRVVPSHVGIRSREHAIANMSQKTDQSQIGEGVVQA